MVTVNSPTGPYRERERESEMGSKCNKGVVNGRGLRVKKENKRWPVRPEEMERIQRWRKSCGGGKGERVERSERRGQRGREGFGESQCRKWNWRLL